MSDIYVTTREQIQDLELHLSTKRDDAVRRFRHRLEQLAEAVKSSQSDLDDGIIGGGLFNINARLRDLEQAAAEHRAFLEARVAASNMLAFGKAE